MSEYIMLFRGGDAQNAQHSPEKMQAHMQRWAQWMAGVQQQGQFISAQPLSQTGKSVKGTKRIVTDGPFPEGKEIVGGYMICKAGTYDQAVEIAKGCPILEFDDGVVEVREIREMKI